MRVSLLYPPPAPATFPYGSLPALTGWLRAHGHSVVQRDLNVETWDWLSSSEGLATTLEQTARKLAHGGEHLCLNPLLPYPGHKRERSDLGDELGQLVSAGDSLMESARDAKTVIRGGPGFSEPILYRHAVSVLTAAA